MDVSELLSTVEKKATKAKKESKSQVKIKDESFDNVMSSISQNWENKKYDEVANLKSELERAKKRIETLESGKAPLSKNEEKIMSAIRSEIIIQNCNEPIISYNKFRKVYKISSDYYRPSINSLIEKGFIVNKEAVFSGSVKTFRWKIIEN